VPTECDVFQIDIFVASSRGANQCAISREHGGEPIPWNHPLSIHAIPKTTTSDDTPKNTLHSADRISPVAKNVRAFDRSPRNPFANFDTPYSTPCSVRNIPSCGLPMPSSRLITGMAIERFLRTK